MEKLDLERLTVRPRATLNQRASIKWVGEISRMRSAKRTVKG